MSAKRKPKRQLKAKPAAPKTKGASRKGAPATGKALTPEQRQYLADKWNEFDTRNRELREATPSHEARFSAAMREVHAFHNESLWFAENTPRPFRSYHPANLVLAAVANRYTCELARLGNEDAIREVAHLANAACECLDELLAGEGPKAENAAEVVGYLARALPYWPMLQMLHTAGNNHFPRLAQKLKLGTDSWANVSDRAGYSLQTPRNRYAWRILRLFQEAHDIIRRANAAKAGGEENHWPQLEHYSLLDDTERQIALDSFELGKPTKASAKDWVDRAVMPIICAREKDFSQVPEFSDAIRRAEHRGKRYSERKEIRRDMIEAVRSIAPEE